MTTPTRPRSSVRMLLLDVLYLARMWASERRFRYHARWRQHHQAAAALHIQGMVDEVTFRTELCDRRASLRGNADMSGTATHPADVSRNGPIIDGSALGHGAETGGGRG